MVTDIIPRYDDLAARDVVDRLETGTYTDDELREIRAYEQNDKDRITVVQKIDELLSDTEEEAADTDDDEFAKIRLGYSGYAAGYTFSSGREVKTVPLTRRVEMRIDDRTLTRVD